MTTPPRKVLSENLKALMAARDERSTLAKITEASRGRLSNGTLGRIRAATHATTVDTLGDLADVFGLEVWQLLVPDLKPKALPQLAGPELLNTIRLLVASEAAVDSPGSSGHTQQSGKKSPVGRLPGEAIRTGQQGSSKSGADRHGALSRKGRRGGA